MEDERPCTQKDRFTGNRSLRLGRSDSESAGQSGDTQGLSDIEEADSESVEELTEEGQGLEADVIDAVENAPDPDVSEVRTREVPEDDVPEEYRDDSSSDVA